MAVKLVFLGRLADMAGAAEREMAGPIDWEGLLASFSEELRHSVAEKRVKIALNGQVLGEKGALLARDGDEIALLPPVSGG